MVLILCNDSLCPTKLMIESNISGAAANGRGYKDHDMHVYFVMGSSELVIL